MSDDPKTDGAAEEPMVPAALSPADQQTLERAAHGALLGQVVDTLCRVEEILRLHATRLYCIEEAIEDLLRVHRATLAAQVVNLPSEVILIVQEKIGDVVADEHTEIEQGDGTLDDKVADVTASSVQGDRAQGIAENAAAVLAQYLYAEAGGEDDDDDDDDDDAAESTP